MFGRSRILVLELALLLPLFLSFSSAAIVCNASLYDNPSPSDCSQILSEIYSLGSKDRKHHLFYTGDFDQQPSDITSTEWKNRVHLAMNLSRDGCSVFLAPGYDATGIPQYDTGTYSSIAKQATHFQGYCSNFPEPEDDRMSSMEGGQAWVGDRGRILAIIYSNTSTFGATFAEHEAKGLQPDLRAISAENPPGILMPQPVCGRSRYCSKASHCRGAIGCICVADTWHGPFFSSTCKWPLSGFWTGRGLLEADGANATQLVSYTNGTLTAESTAGLACPCNCTYVSKACCDSPSGIVYEVPDLRLGSLQAPLVNLTCNAMTGDFQASNMTLDVMLTTR